MNNENLDFAHPIFWAYFMYCAPNIRLLPPPLPLNLEIEIITQLNLSYLLKMSSTESEIQDVRLNKCPVFKWELQLPLDYLLHEVFEIG